MKKLKIPYGNANFENLRNENCLYVDKTKYIELLEDEPKNIFFIRPRRFGKSLFIRMLSSYYDILAKEKFDKLFGDLYIGKNPTENRNSYLILYLNFSGLVTSQGKERFYESLDTYIATIVEAFIDKYKAITGFDNLPGKNKKAESAISYLHTKFQDSNHKIYVLMDEYDNFANDLIRPITTARNSENIDYAEIINSEGYMRTFYKTLKSFTEQTNVRLFMTGVSPILLDDLASGFNVTTNITTSPLFNEMLGFTQQEVISILKKAELEEDEIKTLMKDLHYYYDGYLFSEEATERMFNSDMFLYFLYHYQQNKKYPRQILDNNVKTDYRKIQTLAFNFKDEGTIDELLKNESIKVTLVDRFPVKQMYSNINNFKSILFYLGMLSIQGYNERGELILRIPNYVSKKIYWEYFFDTIKRQSDIKLRSEEVVDMVASLRYEGNIYPLIERIKLILEKLSNRDLQRFDEKYIKAIMFTLIDIDGFYLLHSEPELRNGYADMLLTRSKPFAQYIKYEWLIELKYVKESERKKLDEYRTKGKQQLLDYAASEDVINRFEDKDFRKAVVCFVGKGDVVVDEV